MTRTKRKKKAPITVEEMAQKILDTVSELADEEQEVLLEGVRIELQKWKICTLLDALKKIC